MNTDINVGYLVEQKRMLEKSLSDNIDKCIANFKEDTGCEVSYIMIERPARIISYSDRPVYDLNDRYTLVHIEIQINPGDILENPIVMRERSNELR